MSRNNVSAFHWCKGYRKNVPLSKYRDVSSLSASGFESLLLCESKFCHHSDVMIKRVKFYSSLETNATGYKNHCVSVKKGAIASATL